MTDNFLSIPEHERAFHILSERPRGSTRAWAKELGWSPSRLERFLQNLITRGLAEVERVGNYGSVFRPVPARTAASRPVPVAYLGSSSKSTGLTASRYAEAKDVEKPSTAEQEMARPYIEIANESLKRFSDFKPIRFDNVSSVNAALQMLEMAGGDRGLGYFCLVLNEYQPHKSGGDAPKSLAHPFFLRGVKRRAMAFNRDQAKGQLPILFLERGHDEPRKPGKPEALGDLVRKMERGA